jgi:dihydroxy-acid dehydratase
MACLTEAIGMMLPGGATPPAGTGERLRIGTATGRRAVRMASEQLRPDEILTPAAFRNALVTLSAIGGSTNAVIHLLALAGRAGVPLALHDFDRVSGEVPLLVDCQPTGSGYLEDFHHAGGMPVLLKALESLLDLSARRVDGITLGEYLKRIRSPQSWQKTIRTLDDPLGPPGGLAVVHGSLAPEGAVLKVAAASAHLLKHRGPAFVLESPEDAARRLDDPDLDMPDETVLVLRYAGPAGAGMPEAGSLPLPRRLLRRGVTDMLRISDARMSGTAYGTIVLHCSPEAARGGPLALVRDGDMVELDVEARRLDLLVNEGEMARRRTEFRLPTPPQRGWRRLFHDHVLPAERGADLDFLVKVAGDSGPDPHDT